MKRWLYVSTYVQGDPATARRVLMNDHRNLLLRATDNGAETVAADGSFLLDLPSSFWRRELTKQIRVRVGVASHRDRRTVFPISWEAEPGRQAFPRFEGTLELDAMSRQSSLLAVAGSYEPPLGPVGAALETTVFQDLARQTAQRLVDRLADELSLAMEAVEPGTEATAPISPDMTMTITRHDDDGARV